jgi:cobalamin biosynthesis protein CobC
MTGLQHGGDLDAFGIAHPHATRPLIDLSTGINPTAYAPAIDPSWMTCLPGKGEEDACLAAFAAYAGVDPAYVSLMPGTQAIISGLPHLFESSSVAVLAPTYGEHAASWQAAGHFVSSPTAAEIMHEDAEIIVVTNPNNPDGHFFDPASLSELQNKQKARGGRLVVDEAFVDCAPELSVVERVGEGGLLVLRSFGKFFGLAGLRLGFLVGPDVITQRIAGRLGPWSVSTTALHVGREAYSDAAWITATRALLKVRMNRLRAMVDPALGTSIGGTSLFHLLDVPNAQNVAGHLATHGIFVRTFADMPNYLRMGLPGDAWQWDRLETALNDWK